ncbi:hypothetical protein MOTC310_19240 [Methylobacterium oryzae]|uniref:Uncharacterized protein n=1 Tax=Methylobacterium oryzae TaxID=334852 RepID=A0ABU7TS31_9HYPH
MGKHHGIPQFLNGASACLETMPRAFQAIGKLQNRLAQNSRDDRQWHRSHGISVQGALHRLPLPVSHLDNGGEIVIFELQADERTMPGEPFLKLGR